MSAAPGRWKRTTPPTPEQRLAQYHERLGVDQEELLRRQAIGLRVRDKIVERAFQIPRHRALVVVAKPHRKRRKS